MRATRRGGGIRLRPARWYSRSTAAAQSRRRRWSIRSSRCARSRRGWHSRCRWSSSSDDEFLVLEKATGQVKRVRNGGAPEVVLDLTVNSNSERGLLGITLDKDFRHNGLRLPLLERDDDRRRQHRRRRGAAAGQPARPLSMGRHDADVREDAAPRPRLPGRRDQPANPAAPVFRGNHNGGVVRDGPGRQDLPAGRRHRPPRPDCRTCSTARSARASRTTSSAARTSTNEPPDGRDPAPEPGRHGAAGQPVLQGRRRARRPGRGEPQEDLRLRPAQRRSAWRSTRSAATCGSRRTATTPSARSTSSSAGFNSGWTQVMGPLERVAQFKAIETTRVPDPPDPQRAGGYYGLQQVRWDPSQHRRHPVGGLQPPVQAPGLAVQRPGDGLEVRGRPGRHRLPLRPRSSARSTRATCSSARPAAPCAAATCSGCTIDGQPQARSR